MDIEWCVNHEYHFFISNSNSWSMKVFVSDFQWGRGVRAENFLKLLLFAQKYATTLGILALVVDAKRGITLLRAFRLFLQRLRIDFTSPDQLDLNFADFLQTLLQINVSIIVFMNKRLILRLLLYLLQHPAIFHQLERLNAIVSESTFWLHYTGKL